MRVRQFLSDTLIHIYPYSGIARLRFGEFDPRQPRPENFPARTELAYADGPFNPRAAVHYPFPRPSGPSYVSK